MSKLTSNKLKTNHYDLLEVSMSADEEEIRRAYDRIKQIYSEDSLAIYGLYSTEEIREFRELIEQAFRILIDPENRQDYDRSLIGEPLPRKKKYTVVAKPEAVAGKENGDIDDNEEADEAFDSTRAAEENSGGYSQYGNHGGKLKSATQSLQLTVPEEAEFSGEYLNQLRKTHDIPLRLVSDTTKVSMTNLRLLEAEEWDKLPAVVYVKGFINQYARFLGIDPARIVRDFMKRHEEWERNR